MENLWRRYTWIRPVTECNGNNNRRGRRCPDAIFHTRRVFSSTFVSTIITIIIYTFSISSPYILTFAFSSFCRPPCGRFCSRYPFPHRRHYKYALASSTATHRLSGYFLSTYTHTVESQSRVIIITIIVIYRSQNLSIPMWLVE